MYAVLWCCSRYLNDYNLILAACDDPDPPRTVTVKDTNDMFRCVW